MRIVAVASGTSADELDVGVVDVGLEGSNVTMEIVLWRSHPWPDDLREQILLDLLPPATTGRPRCASLDQRIGVAVADAVGRVVSRARPAAAPGGLAGADGLPRRPRRASATAPCSSASPPGWPSAPASRSSPTCAPATSPPAATARPLASTLDALWLAGPGGPRAALNLGGIANVSVVGDEGEPVQAWDTGPANCLLDVAAAPGHRRPADPRRRRTARGGRHRRPDLLDLLLEHPHFSLAPPVSTGREAFSAGYLDDVLDRRGEVSGPDLLATLTELTALTVARALRAVRRDGASWSPAAACTTRR